MHVFYTPDIQSQAELPEEEAAHAVRVLRLQTGDEVTLTDGKGNFYRAEISTATTKRCLVNILETIPKRLYGADTCTLQWLPPRIWTARNGLQRKPPK